MREDWKIRKLKEVCQIGDGNYSSKYPKASEFTASGVPFITATNLKNGTITPKGIRYISVEQHSTLIKGHTKEGDLVVVVRGSSTGNSSLVPIEYENSNLNSQLAFLRTEINVLNRKYLYYVFNSPEVQRVVNETISGSAQPQLPNNKLLGIEIPLPPLSEQKQIVEILDKALTAIEQAKANLEKNIENAKELFQSKLNDIFSQKVDGWEEKTLGELGKVSMCKRILKKQTTPDGEIPFYKIGTFGKKANSYISKEIYNDFRSKYSFPKKGEILISASGTIGRRVVYDGLPAYFQDSNIVWIDNNEQLVTNDYLYQFYGVCDWNPSKGATISRLYNSDLRKIKISYPSITEQKIIVPKMEDLKSKILQLESNYIRKVEDLNQLKKSILQKAFAGELTNKMAEV